MSITRYVTLRHASSGRWCIEAPHPTVHVPQPYFLPGCRMAYTTLAAAVRDLESNGYIVVRNKAVRYVYRHGQPVVVS